MKEGQSDLVIKIAREKLIPHFATFELTNRCNLSCIHCYLEDECFSDLPTEQVFDIIDQLAAAGTLELSFSGGEVFMRPDFLEILRYGHKKNLAVSFLSNGTLIDERVGAELKKIYCQDVAISLYGLTPEVHEAITGKTGSLQKSLDAVRILRRNNIRVQVKTSVMKQNLAEVPLIAAFCQEVGADFVPSPALFPANKGSLRPLQHRLNDLELRDYLAWEVKNAIRVKGHIQPCNAGFCMVGISAEGEVFPCLMLRINAGKLTEASFSSIWQSSPVLNRIRNLQMGDFKECSQCPLLASCRRCAGQSYYEEKNDLAPCKEICRVTTFRKEMEVT